MLGKLTNQYGVPIKDFLFNSVCVNWAAMPKSATGEKQRERGGGGGRNMYSTCTIKMEREKKKCKKYIHM